MSKFSLFGDSDSIGGSWVPSVSSGSYYFVGSLIFPWDSRTFLGSLFSFIENRLAGGGYTSGVSTLESSQSSASGGASSFWDNIFDEEIEGAEDDPSSADYVRVYVFFSFQKQSIL